MEKMLMKKRCKCGRRIIIARKEKKKYRGFFCATCMTYGWEESTRLFNDLKQQLLKGGNQDETDNI